MDKKSSLSPENFNKMMAFFIALVTVIIALVTYLQSDASNRDDQANRDTKRYSLEAMGRKISGDAKVNFDYNRIYESYYELGLLAESSAAVGDEAGAARYEALREKIKALSPMLAEPYLNPETDQPDVSKYESETYLVETTALMERFTAASIVKDAWDYKANTYIIHLTLLALALFLFGMATTISGNLTRWIFFGTGMVVSLVAVVWMGILYAKPVTDLRDCKISGGNTAIDAYASGVGLAYQEKYEDAISNFDQALGCEPKYANALRNRGDAKAALGNYTEAAGDYEKARAAGDNSASLAGDLAWMYHLLGRFDDAVKMNQEALKASPDELWIQFDLALAHLANGKVDDARREYQKGMDQAAKQVADAKAAGQEPPSYLWWGLDDAAISLEDMIGVLENGEGEPKLDNLADPDTVRQTAVDMMTRLKSMAISLELTGLPPQGELTAKISPFQFAVPQYDDQGNLLEYQPADTFTYGIDEMSVLFDYEGMQDGQTIVFKVYVNGEEDPSWRLVDQWSLGAAGSAEKPLSVSYSNVSVLSAGDYLIEMYVEGHLAQSGRFSITE
jgi:tetratricopeptide (TPR) repeat protein